MATKSTKQQIYLVVHESRDHGYFKLQAHVCEQRYEDHQWLPRFIDDANGVRVGSLQVSCQGDERTQLRDRDDAVYGYACEYREPYAIDLRTAEAMAKTLRIVNNRLNKISEARGYTRSFGDYVGRVAEALGCSGIAVERKETAHNNSRYDWLSIGDGVNRINHRILLWQREAQPAAESEAAS